MSFWKKFIPDLSCKSIMDIPLNVFQENGIKGILFDLDNTITEWHQNEVSPEASNWLKSLTEEGYQVCIVSNNKKQRVAAVAEKLGLPYLCDAAKPAKHSYFKAAKLMNLPCENMAMVGDQILTDVLGGNRSGLFTIFVEYINPQEHWGTVHLIRPLERLVMKKIKNQIS